MKLVKLDDDFTQFITKSTCIISDVFRVIRLLKNDVNYLNRLESGKYDLNEFDEFFKKIISNDELEQAIKILQKLLNLHSTILCQNLPDFMDTEYSKINQH